MSDTTGQPAEDGNKRSIDWLGLAMQWKKELVVLGCMGAVLIGPFLLRPAQSTAPSRYDKRLVLMTPHHELIRQEFGRGFAKHWKEKTGQTIYIDWRVAGTSELATLIKSDYSAAFERHWRKQGKEWSEEVALEFINGKAPADAPARRAFLESNVGIGVDLFFGGGPYDFQQQADAGTLVAADAATGAGLKRIREQNPQLFSAESIPESLSGERFHDAEMRWSGTCLSSFGIVFNRDTLKRLGVTEEPDEWADLADPRLRGYVALSDPTKSGSVTKAFEMIIQQEMHEAVARVKAAPGRLRTPEEIEAAGVRQGWIAGLQLIQRIAANARYFTDMSTKIPLEVAKGDAGAGMCIDFYGRSSEESVRDSRGRSRVGFIAPTGGTAISVDPVGLFRGAAEPELAEAFMQWVLSDAGQKIWSYRRGMPGGPEKAALRRLPVRRDFYSDTHRTFMSDANEEPWKKAEAFVYRPEWTAPAFNSIRFLIKVLCVDTHRELRSAWDALADAGLPPRAMEIFGQMVTMNYDVAVGDLANTLRSRDKVREVREARRLTDAIRRQYEKAEYNAEVAARRGGE
jgi:iron(III) transport system substrate-binding protein